MKFPLLVLAFLLPYTLVMIGQTGHPVPSGIREADKLPHPADIRPQVCAKQKPAYSARMQRDALELARLAQLIPSEVEQAKNARLPKDLDGQLKQIEKLSRQLRREISRP